MQISNGIATLKRGTYHEMGPAPRGAAFSALFGQQPSAVSSFTLGRVAKRGPVDPFGYLLSGLEYPPLPPCAKGPAHSPTGWL